MGEAVAAVVAESRYIAEDAIDLIEVEYEPLPVVVDPEQAITSSGDAVLHPERGPNNIALQRTLTFGPVEDDFAAADRVIRRKMRWPRSGGQPMETVGAVADFDEGMGKFTIHTNISMYNYVGWLIAVSLNVPAHRLNIVPVIAGGSFGSKLFAHKVPVLAATLARAAGQPVKFLEDRIDNITSCDNHGSDRVYDMEVAVMNDGTITSLRMKVIDDYGAYLQFGVGHHGNAAAQLTGPYRIGSGEIDLTAVLTNKCQQGAYRGFGSEVTNFVLERMVDAAADELGMDPAVIRRKNFIQPDQFPYKIPTGNVYDSGDYGTVVNPMTLAGHVRGGTAQGIGSAVYEHFYYDDDGQLLAGTYADYLIPTLKEVPANIRVGHVETPSPFTEFGIKGGGEGGRMGAPPTIAAAVEDALRPLGVKVDGLPITPLRLRELIREAVAGA